MDGEPQSDQLDEISSLLAGDAPIEGEPPADDQIPEKDEAEGPDENQEPDEVEEGAEDDAAAIDYDMMVPMPDGRDAMSLGELKDKVSNLARTEQQIVEKENDLMRQNAELVQAMQLSGVEITPQLQARMAEQNNEHLSREHLAMLKAIPDWSDRTVFEADRQEIAQVGASYGFSPQEIASVSDHRMVKLFRDHTKLLARQKAATENVEQLHKARKQKGVRPKAQTSTAKLDKQVAAAVGSKDETVKMAAIDNLLR